MGRFSLIAAVLWALWGSPAWAAGEARPGEGLALRGLTVAVVGTGEVSPEALQAGVSEEALLAGVRDRVQRAGVSAQGGPEAPRLLLDVQVFHLKAAGLLAFCLTLSLEEAVDLPRQPGVRVPARTWTASSVGTSLSGKFGEVLRGVAERLADRFADEVALANPPQ